MLAPADVRVRPEEQVAGKAAQRRGGKAGVAHWVAVWMRHGKAGLAFRKRRRDDAYLDAEVTQCISQ
jgi:hypothetical protein